MAVVFISPRKRQRTFFVAITVALLLFLGFISLGVISSKPPKVDSTVVFNSAKINIDMSIFDSVRFKNLKSPPEMGIQFRYKALTKSKRAEEGFISSGSIAQAREKLEGMGLTVQPSIYLQHNDELFAPEKRGSDIRIEDGIIDTTDGCCNISKKSQRQPDSTEAWIAGIHKYPLKMLQLK